jgi:hypothetical protein
VALCCTEVARGQVVHDVLEHIREEAELDELLGETLATN